MAQKENTHSVLMGYLPMDLRVYGGHRFLLRQADFGGYLVLHARAVLHRLDYRPVPDSSMEREAESRFIPGPVRLQHHLDSVDFSRLAGHPPALYGQVFFTGISTC